MNSNEPNQLFIGGIAEPLDRGRGRGLGQLSMNLWYQLHHITPTQINKQTTMARYARISFGYTCRE